MDDEAVLGSSAFLRRVIETQVSLADFSSCFRCDAGTLQVHLDRAVCEALNTSPTTLLEVVERHRAFVEALFHSFFAGFATFVHSTPNFSEIEQFSTSDGYNYLLSWLLAKLAAPGESAGSEEEQCRIDVEVCCACWRVSQTFQHLEGGETLGLTSLTLLLRTIEQSNAERGKVGHPSSPSPRPSPSPNPTHTSPLIHSSTPPPAQDCTVDQSNRPYSPSLFSPSLENAFARAPPPSAVRLRSKKYGPNRTSHPWYGTGQTKRASSEQRKTDEVQAVLKQRAEEKEVSGMQGKQDRRGRQGKRGANDSSEEDVAQVERTATVSSPPTQPTSGSQPILPPHPPPPPSSSFSRDFPPLRSRQPAPTGVVNPFAQHPLFSQNGRPSPRQKPSSTPPSAPLVPSPPQVLPPLRFPASFPPPAVSVHSQPSPAAPLSTLSSPPSSVPGAPALSAGSHHSSRPVCEAPGLPPVPVIIDGVDQREVEGAEERIVQEREALAAQRRRRAIGSS